MPLFPLMPVLDAGVRQKFSIKWRAACLSIRVSSMDIFVVLGLKHRSLSSAAIIGMWIIKIWLDSTWGIISCLQSLIYPTTNKQSNVCNYKKVFVLGQSYPIMCFYCIFSICNYAIWSLYLLNFIPALLLITSFGQFVPLIWYSSGYVS